MNFEFCQGSRLHGALQARVRGLGEAGGGLRHGGVHPGRPLVRHPLPDLRGGIQLVSDLIVFTINCSPCRDCHVIH